MPRTFLPGIRAFGHLAFSMVEGTDGGLEGQPERLQQYLTTFKLPWVSSTGNTTGEVEFLARGEAADTVPTWRSLSERRITASQHRGKVIRKILAKLAAASAAVNFVRVQPLKCASPCGGSCGFPLGRGGPGGSSPAPPRPPFLGREAY